MRTCRERGLLGGRGGFARGGRARAGALGEAGDAHAKPTVRGLDARGALGFGSAVAVGVPIRVPVGLPVGVLPVRMTIGQSIRVSAGAARVSVGVRALGGRDVVARRGMRGRRRGRALQRPPRPGAARGLAIHRSGRVACSGSKEASLLEENFSDAAGSRHLRDSRPDPAKTCHVEPVKLLGSK